MNKRLRKKQRKQRRITSRRRGVLLASADVPTQFFAESDEPVQLLAAGEGVEADEPRKFTMMAYGGGKMMPRGFGFPVVCELAGMRVMGGDRPIHFAHDQTRPVGHADTVEIKKSVRAAGAFSVDNEDSRMIQESGKNGFPWRSSIGITYDKIEFVDDGSSIKANGRNFKGPCYYVPKSTLFEISFVTVAGDNSSNAKIAASMATPTSKEESMFEKWLEARGFVAADLSDAQRKHLQATYDSEQSPPADTVPAATGTVEASGNVTPPATIDLEAERQLRAAEVNRCGAISKICATYGNPTIEVDGSKLILEAYGIEQGWTEENVELHALRASRTTAPAIHTSSSEDVNASVLEAAARLSLGQDGDTLLADYGEKVVNIADEYNNIGLRELAAFSCRVEGVDVPNTWGDGRKVLKAAFSTETLPSVLENVMNKTLLPIYEAMESIAKQVCAVGRTSDYKQTSNVRLLGSGQWTKVGADGELKHGQISDEKFTNQAETYGQYMMLNHQTWKNDDLGALEKMATYMAIMGNQVVEDTFFEVLLGNANNFFHANNSNLGAGVAFGPTGLGDLKTLFRKQKKGPGTRAKNARPVNVRPVTLLTSVELEDDAASLLGSPNLIMDGVPTSSASKAAPKNPHFQKYNLLSAPQMSDSTFTGYSETAYYLFSDPRILAALELIFVDGIQTPTIERVDPSPNTLGQGFRGYINFGCSQQDPKGAAKDAGA